MQFYHILYPGKKWAIIAVSEGKCLNLIGSIFNMQFHMTMYELLIGCDYCS